MKKIIVLLFFSTVVLGFGQNKEIVLINKCFDNYKVAVLNNDGKNAVKFVASKTLKYYNNLLFKVKLADSSSIKLMNVLDKMNVFTARHLISKKEILSLNAKKFFIYAVNNEFSGIKSVDNSKIKIIEIKDDFARGELYRNDQSTGLFFDFYKKKWNLEN